MFDFSNELGIRAWERLATEQTIWLTTVAPSGAPHPRPVWFLWEDGAFLITSEPAAKKLEHIARNPLVALHFNSTSEGEDVQVFLATATIERDPPSERHIKAYLAKYRASIQAIGTTPEILGARFTVLIRAVPTRLRGIV